MAAACMRDVTSRKMLWDLALGGKGDSCAGRVQVGSTTTRTSTWWIGLSTPNAPPDANPTPLLTFDCHDGAVQDSCHWA